MSEYGRYNGHDVDENGIPETPHKKHNLSDFIDTDGVLPGGGGSWESPEHKAWRIAKYSTPQRRGCLGSFVGIATVGLGISSLLAYLGYKGIEFAGNHLEISQIVKEIGNQLRTIV
jgi:hypothetical protein